MSDAQAAKAEKKVDKKSTNEDRGFLDRYFQISERNSTVGTEIRGGVVTFFAMAYIIILNPLILGTSADINGDELGTARVAAVTALAAGVMTIAFGVIARYPFGIAAGLGINTLVAVTFVGTEGLSWPEAMGLVVIDGILIVLLAISGFREAVFNSIPASLKAAIGVGIGLFIALIGLVDSGFVRRIPDAAGTTVPVGLGINGSIASWPTLVFILGLLICGTLVVRQVRGGLFIGIVANTIIAMIVEAITHTGPSFVNGEPNPKGWNLAVPQGPDSLGGIPDLSLVGAVDLFGAFTRVGVLAACMLIFTLVLANFFDAMGTMTALGKQAKLADAAEPAHRADRRGRRCGRRRCRFRFLEHRVRRLGRWHRRWRPYWSGQCGHRSAVHPGDVLHPAVRGRADRGRRPGSGDRRCDDDGAGQGH